MTTQQIAKRQQEILEQMGQIRLMERGTVTPQRYAERAKRKGGNGAVMSFRADEDRAGRRIGYGARFRFDRHPAQMRMLGQIAHIVDTREGDIGIGQTLPRLGFRQ